MVTKRCNLQCPHCTIRTEGDDGWNEKEFFRQLSSFQGRKILFGGEPSICIERTKKAAEYCNSISTNLLCITDEFCQAIKSLQVATSWTPARFDAGQEEKWIANVKRIEQKPTLLVTLTPDLICQAGTSRFLDLIKQYGNLFSGINLEQLVDPEKEESYYRKVDEWLCSLYDKTEEQRRLFFQFQPDYQWKFKCADTYTLLPDGTLRYGCPQYTKAHVPEVCYTCSHAAECQPCRLQRKCSCPQKLMKKVHGIEVNNPPPSAFGA